MKGLTPRQRALLDYIHTYVEKHRYSPSYREIMRHFSLSSPGTVYKHIRSLIQKGALQSEKGATRSLKLSESPKPTPVNAGIEIPYIGKISCGHPIELFKQTQMLPVPPFLVPHPENTYVLSMKDHLLSHEGIMEGDYLIVEARQEAHVGELILGIINGHDTVIRHYYPEGHYARLESSSHQPLIVRADHLAVQGIIVGLIRGY